MLPPLCLTIPYTVARPNPVPLPFSFVVKKGSKMCAKVSASIPTPVSLTASITCGPAAAPMMGLGKALIQNDVRSFES